MKASFENTVNILVKAYLNDTLKHEDCAACAVGNILGTNSWAILFVTPSCFEGVLPQIIAPADYVIGVNGYGDRMLCAIKDYPEVLPKIEKANSAIEQSGYSITELARIENAFEAAPKGKDDDEWMFNGLMAVVDVLADIHQVDLSVKESAKLLFVKA